MASDRLPSVLGHLNQLVWPKETLFHMYNRRANWQMPLQIGSNLASSGMGLGQWKHARNHKNVLVRPHWESCHAHLRWDLAADMTFGCSRKNAGKPRRDKNDTMRLSH